MAKKTKGFSEKIKDNQTQEKVLNYHSFTMKLHNLSEWIAINGDEVGTAVLGNIGMNEKTVVIPQNWILEVGKEIGIPDVSMEADRGEFAYNESTKTQHTLMFFTICYRRYRDIIEASSLTFDVIFKASKPKKGKEVLLIPKFWQSKKKFSFLEREKMKNIDVYQTINGKTTKEIYANGLIKVTKLCRNWLFERLKKRVLMENIVKIPCFYIDDGSGYHKDNKIDGERPSTIFAELNPLLEKKNVKRISVIEGFTEYSQPNDLNFNAVFKTNYKIHARKYLETPSFTKSKNLKLPSKDELVRWYCSSFNSITDEVVKRGFLRAGIGQSDDVVPAYFSLLLKCNKTEKEEKKEEK